MLHTDELSPDELRERDEREREQFLSTRRGSGRARAEIQRKVAARADGKSVSGAGIIIRPKTFGRDAYRALMHFCRQNGVTLRKIVTITAEERGVAHDTTITWLAIGDAAGLAALRDHSYVGAGNWQYATTAQVAQMGG